MRSLFTWIVFLFSVCCGVFFFISCSPPFDKEKAFTQAKFDCANSSDGLCDSDIKILRDNDDTADANIAEAYRVGKRYTH
jgi:hypothetical protein